jgi:hypothetical protein
MRANVGIWSHLLTFSYPRNFNGYENAYLPVLPPRGGVIRLINCNHLKKKINITKSRKFEEAFNMAN